MTAFIFYVKRVPWLATSPRTYGDLPGLLICIYYQHIYGTLYGRLCIVCTAVHTLVV